MDGRAAGETTKASTSTPTPPPCALYLRRMRASVVCIKCRTDPSNGHDTAASRRIAAATLNKKIDVSGGLTVGSVCAVWFEDRVWYGRVQRYGMFNSKSRSMKTFIAPLNLAERVAGVSIFFSWYDNAPKSCLVGTGLSESDLSGEWLTHGPEDVEPGVLILQIILFHV